MNKYTIEFSKDSKSDLLEINNYIKYSLQEPNIAEKLMRKIRGQINKLEYNPEIYAIIDDDYIKKLKIRKIKIDNYFVFYRIKEKNRVQIVRIIYGRRNWNVLLK